MKERKRKVEDAWHPLSNPCEELPPGAERTYVDRMVMPQQTEDWHRALQGTPPQMGILEGQPRSKLYCGSELHTMQHLLQCHSLEQVCTAEDLAAYNNNTAQKCVQHWLNSI